MKTGLFVLGLFFSAAAMAGRFEIIGEGTASMPAEFIRVNITVASECHTSALSARQDVDQLSQKAVAVLEKYKTNIPDQLAVSPDANIQAVKTFYVDGRQVIICDADHSWTSTTAIQFKLNNLQLLAELQDGLLGLNQKIKSNIDLNVEHLTISLSAPIPGVFADTWDKMSDLALQRAHANALRQVRVLSEGMNNPTIELSRVTTTANKSGQIVYDRVDAEGDTSGVSLGKVSLKLARQFTFNVTTQ